MRWSNAGIVASVGGTSTRDAIAFEGSDSGYTNSSRGKIRGAA